MIDLQLSSLTVVKKADHIGRDEPMVWTMFIELSLDAVNRRQFVRKTDPVAGKLAKAGKGDRVTIPAAVGRWRTEESGIGMVGVAVIGFDNDLRSNNQIRSGYNAGAAALNQAIIDHFPKHGLAPVEAAEQAEIETKIRNAVKEAFLADSVVLTIFGGKPLGGGSYTRVLDENTIDEPVTLTLRAKHDWAIYRIDGRLQFQRPQG
jgi:predicted secreted protein